MTLVISPSAVERLLETLRADLSDGFWLDDFGYCQTYRNAHRTVQAFQTDPARVAAAGRLIQDAVTALQRARIILLDGEALTQRRYVTESEV